MKPKGWRNESRRHALASKGIKTAQKIPRMPKKIISKFLTPYMKTLYSSGELRRRWGLETDSGSMYFRLRNQGKSDEEAQYVVYESRALILDGKITPKGYLFGLRDDFHELTTSDLQGVTDVRSSQFMEDYGIKKDFKTQMEISDIMLNYANGELDINSAKRYLLEYMGD